MLSNNKKKLKKLLKNWKNTRTLNVQKTICPLHIDTNGIDSQLRITHEVNNSYTYQCFMDI